jgi:hypothetical protein
VCGLVVLVVSNQILRNFGNHSSKDLESRPRKPESSKSVSYIPAVSNTNHINICHLYNFETVKHSTFQDLKPRIDIDILKQSDAYFLTVED